MTRRGSVLIRTKQSLHGSTVGGEGKLMRLLASALHETGWEVEILCPKPRPSKTGRKLPVTYHNFDYYSPTSFRERILQSFRGAGTLRRVLRANDYDVFLDSVANLPFFPAYVLTPPETTRAMYIHSALGGFSWELFDPLVALGSNVVEQSLVLSGAALICNGDTTEDVIESYPGNADTYLLRTSIDLSEFEPAFDPDSKTILSLGRLSPEKNVECLLRAWASIEDDYSEYTVKVAGDGEREQYLKRFADELDLRNVEFLGYTEGAEKRRLFRDALLFVFPSLLEGYGTTGLEALASKTPVVGADTPGITDYIRDGHNGYLFERDNPRDLARVLEEALRYPERLARMAEAGRETAEQHTYSKFRDRADATFTELLDEKGPRTATTLNPQ